MVQLTSILLVGGLVLGVSQQEVRRAPSGEGWLRPVQNERGLYGYATRSGAVVIPHRFRRAYPFSEGLAEVQAIDGSELGGLIGFIDVRGRLVISHRFTSTEAFAGGRAIVGVTSGDGQHFGVIDRRGEWVAPPVFAHIESWNGGEARAHLNARMGYVNALGETVIAPRFDVARSFSEEGIAAVAVAGEWGYINLAGEFLVGPQYAEAADFQGGFGRVQCDDQTYGFVNTTGRLATSCTWSDRALVPFREGTAYGHQRTDKRLLPITPGRSPASFERRLAIQERSSGFSFAFAQGHENAPAHDTDVADRLFESILPCEDGRFVVADETHEGIVDERGNLIVPMRN